MSCLSTLLLQDDDIQNTKVNILSETAGDSQERGMGHVRPVGRQTKLEEVTLLHAVRNFS